MATVVVDYLESNCPKEIAEFPVFKRVKERYERMAQNADSNLKADNETSPSFLKTYRQMLLEVIRVKREELKKMHRGKEYSDQLLKAQERELDLEEARTRKT